MLDAVSKSDLSQDTTKGKLLGDSNFSLNTQFTQLVILNSPFE